MAKIYPQKRNGKLVGYSVYLGVGHDGRRQRRFVKHLVDAEKLVEAHNADARPLGELFERKAELLYAIEQIRSLRVTLPEVVTFYVRHHVHKSNPTLSELVELFIAEKKRIGRSEHYARSIRYHLDGLMEHVGRNVHVIEEIKSSGVTTLTRIAQCLTRRGIPTRTGKSVWFASTVKTVAHW